MQGLKEAYERHHKCVYEPAALDAAVALSTRYIADRQLPDKVCLAGARLDMPAPHWLMQARGRILPKKTLIRAAPP